MKITRPWMHDREIELIRNHLDWQDTVLEWGGGGSTVYFPKFTNKKYYSIEHGRARGWCAEYVLKYLHKDSIIFMHDFWERPQYHVVFEWYDEVDSVKDTLQTIVALKPKKQYIND